MSEATPPPMAAEPARNIAGTTTASQDLVDAGKRRVNILWEMTQSFIAVTVTVFTLYVAAALALKENAQTAAFLLLSNAFFLVIGFYFGRTNHQRQGGVGPEPTR